jgi:serine/threonine-protein kinase
MNLEAGSTLAHYEITAQLGEGGMGEVYRAEDTKLGREVAIKVLPPAFTEDPERFARFEREARVLASLNHPNIAAIYDLAEDQGTHFLVLELAEGEDLAASLSRGPIPVMDALPLASQIAEALEAAHDKGIVHRDLKPANVMLGPDGTVKVLDFGLARASEPDADAADLTRSPTLTAQMTQAGVILGTAAYMSPEQARGQVVDKRADIWAFGVVLYEMLAGQRLFGGPSVADVLGAVMRAEIDVDELPGEVPGAIRTLVDRCLVRDPKNRLRDIGEARIEIAGVLADPVGAGGDDRTRTGGPSPAPTRIRRFVPWIAAAAVGLAGLWVGANFIKAPEAEVVHSSIQLPEGVRLAGWSSPAVAISPDERTIAFVGHLDGRQQLYLRRLDQPEAVVVPDSDGAEGPFFSPNGRWVAFGAGAISGLSSEPRLLKRAPVGGGTTQQLAPLTDYVGGTWGTDGYIYYGDGFVKNWLRRVAETGGEPEPLFADSRGDQLADVMAAWPQYIEDGRRLLLTSLRTQSHRAIVLDLETGEVEDIDQPSTFARYAPSGHLVFVREDGLLMAAPFDPKSSRKLGAPVAVVRDVAFTCNDAAVFAIGGKGTALYTGGFVRGSNRVLSRLVRIDPADGSVERLPFAAEAFAVGISVSPDAQRLVVATWDGSLWVYDLSRGTRLKLPDGGVVGRRGRPEWSPDGTKIAFSIEDPDNDGAHLYVQAADGTGEARMLSGAPGETYARAWTPDSGEVVFRQYSDISGLFRVSVAEDGPPQPRQIPIQGSRVAVSPDGRWLAYDSGATGRSEIYLQPFPDGGAVVPVSSKGGTQPRWSSSGKKLYYNSGCGFFAVDIRPGSELELGAPRLLFEHCDPSDRRNVSFSVDSEDRFYLLEAVPESGVVTSLELVQNWGQNVSAALGEGRSD